MRKDKQCYVDIAADCMLYHMAVFDPHDGGDHPVLSVGKGKEKDRYGLFFRLDIYAGIFSDHSKHHGFVEAVIF